MNDRDEEEVIYGTPATRREEILILTPIALIAIAEIAALIWWLLR